MADKFKNFLKIFLKLPFLYKVWLKLDIQFKITSGGGKQRDKQTEHFRWILPLETSLKHGR